VTTRRAIKTDNVIFDPERPPDLQALVQAHGSYDQISGAAWRAYDHELALWRSRSAAGDFHRQR
jgi:hypothetical protein